MEREEEEKEREREIRPFVTFIPIVYIVCKDISGFSTKTIGK